MYKITLVDNETLIELEYLEVRTIFQTLNLINNHHFSFESAKKKYSTEQSFFIIISYNNVEIIKIVEDDLLVSLYAEKLYDIIDVTLLDVSSIIKIGYFLHTQNYEGLSMYLKIKDGLRLGDLSLIKFKDDYTISVDDPNGFLLRIKDNQLEIKKLDEKDNIIETIYKDVKDIVSFVSYSIFSDAHLEVCYGF